MERARPDFFLLRTAPRNHQLPTADRQPPPTTNRQPLKYRRSQDHEAESVRVKVRFLFALQTSLFFPLAALTVTPESQEVTASGPQASLLSCGGDVQKGTDSRRTGRVQRSTLHVRRGTGANWTGKGVWRPQRAHREARPLGCDVCVSEREARRGLRGSGKSGCRRSRPRPGGCRTVGERSWTDGGGTGRRAPSPTRPPSGSGGWGVKGAGSEKSFERWAGCSATS